eukprot:g3410.t1
METRPSASAAFSKDNVKWTSTLSLLSGQHLRNSFGCFRETSTRNILLALALGLASFPMPVLYIWTYALATKDSAGTASYTYGELGVLVACGELASFLFRQSKRVRECIVGGIVRRLADKNVPFVECSVGILVVLALFQSLEPPFVLFAALRFLYGLVYVCSRVAIQFAIAHDDRVCQRNFTSLRALVSHLTLVAFVFAGGFVLPSFRVAMLVGCVVLGVAWIALTSHTMGIRQFMNFVRGHGDGARPYVIVSNAEASEASTSAANTSSLNMQRNRPKTKEPILDPFLDLSGLDVPAPDSTYDLSVFDGEDEAVETSRKRRTSGGTTRRNKKKADAFYSEDEEEGEETLDDVVESLDVNRSQSWDERLRTENFYSDDNRHFESKTGSDAPTAAAVPTTALSSSNQAVSNTSRGLALRVVVCATAALTCASVLSATFMGVVSMFEGDMELGAFTFFVSVLATVVAAVVTTNKMGNRIQLQRRLAYAAASVTGAALCLLFTHGSSNGVLLCTLLALFAFSSAHALIHLAAVGAFYRDVDAACCFGRGVLGPLAIAYLMGMNDWQYRSYILLLSLGLLLAGVAMAYLSREFVETEAPPLGEDKSEGATDGASSVGLFRRTEMLWVS